LFSYTLFFLSPWIKDSTFCFLFSDEENPKRFAAAAPTTDTPAIDKSPSQEVDPAVKSPKAPRALVKKIVATHGSKRVKKSTDAGASLEAHRSTSSSDDVRADAGIFDFVSCLILIFTYFSGQTLMKKFVTLGNECVEYLKATRASEGNLLSYTLLIFSAFLCFFTRLLFPLC
jgi:hypothetical protein